VPLARRLSLPTRLGDSAATIAADWQQWTTAATFSLNTALGLSGNANGGTINSSSWFNIVNVNSGLCVDAANRATANGTFVQQWACGAQQFNQEWQPDPALELRWRRQPAVDARVGRQWPVQARRCWQRPLPRRTGRLDREWRAPADL